jgi:hypothetical protein
MAGWTEILGDAGLPFTHLTVPAVSGHAFGSSVRQFF